MEKKLKDLIDSLAVVSPPIIMFWSVQSYFFNSINWILTVLGASIWAYGLMNLRVYKKIGESEFT